MLKVWQLRKQFGGVKAVDNVSFELAAGKFLALIGPNGAGKSTCFNLINGQLQPDSGRVLLAGEDITGLSPRIIGRKGVGRTFQIPATFGSLSVLENVQLALASHAGRAFGLWRRLSSQYYDQAYSLLEQVGMHEQAQRTCDVLAYGDVKRVELAIALSGDPRLLLMDEPTAGMAVQERHDIMNLARELVKQRNLAVLFTEHSLDVVFAHADEVVVMARGQVIARGEPDAIQQDPKVREVYLGRGPQGRGLHSTHATNSEPPQPEASPL